MIEPLRANASENLAGRVEVLARAAKQPSCDHERGYPGNDEKETEYHVIRHQRDTADDEREEPGEQHESDFLAARRHRSQSVARGLPGRTYPRGTVPNGGTSSRGRDLIVLSSGERRQRANHGTISQASAGTSSTGTTASHGAL